MQGELRLLGGAEVSASVAHAGEEGVVDALEVVEVLARQAEHAGDDTDRETLAELRDEVDLALLRDARSEVLGGLLGELLDHLGGRLFDDGEPGDQLLADELTGDDAAAPAVLGAFAHIEDGLAERRLGAEVVLPLHVVHAAGEVAAGTAALVGVPDVLVAADEEAVLEAVVVNGLPVANLLVEGEGVEAVLFGKELAGFDDGGFGWGRHSRLAATGWA